MMLSISVCTFSAGEATYIVLGGVLVSRGFDTVGDETEDSADPEEEGEAPKQQPAELDPLWGRLRRGQHVGTVSKENLLGSLRRETLVTGAEVDQNNPLDYKPDCIIE